LVCTDILEPLGLTRTGFDHTDFPDLAPGLRVDLDGGLHPAELTGHGVFSPIGGMISTVDDIGTWMSAHLDALDDLDAEPGTLRHVLTGNQQGRRITEHQRSKHPTETPIYGYGQETRLDARFGRGACRSGSCSGC